MHWKDLDPNDPLVSALATPAQLETLVMARECGVRSTARQLGKGSAAVSRTLTRLARRVSEKLAVPETPGFTAHATSTLHKYEGDDGRVVLRWVKEHREAQTLEAIADEISERTTPIRAIKAAGRGDRNLCLEIPVGDLHMGMYAWAEESGADYDCDIASRLLVKAVSLIVERAPMCRRIIFANLGDYYHSDNRAGTTERSGNVLDMDGRLTRVIDAGIDAMAAAIEICAAACQELTVINLPGNHDPVSAHWIARVMAQRYRHSKHIDVRTCPKKRHYAQHGNTLLGYTHGDRVKAADLVGLMAQEHAQAWADTRYRVWRCGHVHHARRHRQNDTEEYQGSQVEYFGVLAAKDAWHTEGGYTSRRYLQGIVHDALYGESQRITVTADECRG